MRCGNVLGRVRLSVWALTLESLDLETSFWYAGTSSECIGQVRVSLSSGQGQGHRNKNVARPYTRSRVVRLRLKGNLV